MMINFKTVKPHPYLSRFIKHYWFLTASKKSSCPLKNRIFPDTYTDIIINGGDPLIRPNGQLNQAKSFISGIMKKPETVKMQGRINLAGICFKPGAAYAFLGIPIHEITGKSMALELLCRPFYRELEEALLQLKSVPAKVLFLDQKLTGILKEISTPDPAVEYVVSALLRHDGNFKTRDLEYLTGFSARQMQRKFRHFVGISPKNLGRIMRFKKALLKLSACNSSIVDIALETGYSDQAHLSREIKELTGFTAAQFLHKNPGHVAFFQD